MILFHVYSSTHKPGYSVVFVYFYYIFYRTSSDKTCLQKNYYYDDDGDNECCKRVPFLSISVRQIFMLVVKTNLFWFEIYSLNLRQTKISCKEFEKTPCVN